MFVIDPAPFGGAETVVAALTRGMAARGAEVNVVTLQRPPSGPRFSPAAGERWTETAIASGKRAYLREVRALGCLIRDWRPDVIHTHVYHADVVGYLAARRSGMPIVSTVHGLTGGSLRNRVYQWIDLRVVARMDAAICVSEQLVHALRQAGAHPERLHLVPNAHDGSEALPRDAARAAVGVADIRSPLIGWIGRLSREKGADVFVDAVGRLRGDFSAVIIGDGPERSALEKQIRARNAPVTLLGAIPDAGRLVRAFDVLAITSRSEGLPMTVLHAMAAGVPVVATAVGGLPEALGADAGWLVECHDGVIAAALQEAITDRLLSERRAQRARARLEDRYSLKRWIDAYDRVYDECARRRLASRSTSRTPGP
jgi:glycosyltransferase involved in cell wall biosynthesis